MSEVAHEQFPTIPTRPFRIDIPLHELLQTPAPEPPRPTDRQLRVSVC